MELLYLWVDHFRNITGQGFNFSPQYSFSYQNGRHTLQVTGNAIQPVNFFHPNISNITAIIGRNGAGKSNLLDLLRHVFNDAIESELTLFLIFQEKPGTIEVFHPFDTSQFRVEGNHTLKINNHQINGVFNLSQELAPYGTLNNAIPIFISPNIDFRTSLHSEHYEINLSADSLLKNDVKDMRRHKEESLEFFRVQQVGRQVDFITSSYSFKLPFRMPEQLMIRVLHTDLTIKSGVIGEELEYFKGLWHTENDQLAKEEEQLIARNYDVAPVKLQRLRNNFAGMIVRVVMFHLWENKTELYPSDYYKKLENYRFIDVLKLWIREYAPLNKDQRHVAYNFLVNGLTLIDNCEWDEEVGERWFVIKAANFYEVKDYYLKFTAWFKDAYQLEFNWVSFVPFGGIFRKHAYYPHHLSSGEVRFLDLFAKFYNARTYLDVRKKEGKEINFLYLLIDEGETGFHPQWQKEYLSTLIRQLPVIFNEYRIQIILTTHSPIIASDLPKDNIIFLDKDDAGECLAIPPGREEETFGANIYSLYTDAFFLQNGLMGELAKHKINAAIRWLKGEDNIPIKDTEKFIDSYEPMDEARARYIIHHIGEPVLRKKLSQLLQERNR